MPDIRHCTSIAQAATFQNVVSDYVDSVVRRARMKIRTFTDEKTQRVRLADASVDASYTALVAVIDAYCAEKVADCIDRTRLVDVDELNSSAERPED